MPNNTIHNENEKLLKIFAGIRCLNKDQLPRYLEGRLTDVEKHLVEQHLVDCDLCAEALLALQQEGLMEQYPSLSTGIQQYIRDSIKPVSQVHKMEHYARKVKQRESMLIYFWLAAFILGGGALLFGINQYNGRKPATARTAVPVVSASIASPAPAPAPADSTQLQSSRKPASLAAANPATPAPVIPAVKKDTVKAAPAVKKPVVDSAAKRPPVTAPKPPDSSKKTADKPKDNAETAAKPAAKDTPAALIAKNKEKENEKNNDNKPKTGANAAPATAPATSGKVDTDEYLYKAAMVYQQHGDLDEAISRYKHLSSVNNSRVGEMARYQMAVCYRSKGQMGKAKRMFKEVVRMDGTMKQAAQQALDNM